MVKPIVRDIFLLSGKSQTAQMSDIGVGDDLLDTLKANESRCVGLAANMIGVRKRVIAFRCGHADRLMFNPEIIKKSMPYEAEEGCLSLDGVRTAKRFRVITVKWQDKAFRWHTETFTGFDAQIIQHEIDHCDGILI